MKILHVVHNYFPSHGGTQVLFKQVSERLVKNYGDEVIVCTTDSMYGPEKKFFQPVGIAAETINRVAVKRFSFHRFHLRLLRALHKVFVVLKATTPAWIYTGIHGPWSPAMSRFIQQFDGDVICGSACNYAFMTYPLQRNIRKPFVFMGAVHFKEALNKNPLTSTMLEAIKKSTSYIANTQYEKQRLMALGVPANIIRVIGCGVDLEPFQQASDVAAFRAKYNLGVTPIVGFVGRHEPFKGIETLITAMEQLWLTGKTYQLVIAGSPTQYTTELQLQVSQLGKLANNITFISNFSDEEKAAIYQNLDVFVSVSTEESFGIVYLEAWACKKPVIGANIGAVRSVIDEGINGFVVEPADTNMLAQRIEELCEDPGKRTAIGNSGFDKVVENYTWDIITHKYRQVYEQAKHQTEKPAAGVSVISKDVYATA